MAGTLEEAGFEVRDVESLREHYARTLRAWVTNLEANWAEASRLTSVGRARVWQLYMAASAVGFQDGELGLHQVLGVVPGDRGDVALPGTRRPWY
jgi:cyclopropane-fatty-acyl-phospholipid synthase